MPSWGHQSPSGNGNASSDGSYLTANAPLHLFITLLPTTLITSTAHTVKMKFFSVITGALLASSAAALSIGTTKNVQSALADDLSVPGDNPLNYCAKPEDNILEIETVDLSPNPPTA